jgi:hypothetical protein
MFKFEKAIIPNLNRAIVKKYEKYLNNKAIKVPIIEYPNCYKNCCHDNVKNLVNEYSGYSIKGYYLVVETNFKKSIAIYHSIWNYNNQFIDPTPFEEGILYHTFIPSKKIKRSFFAL